MSELPTIPNNNLLKPIQKEPGFLSAIINSAKSIFNGLSDIFTGDSYKKTKTLRVEQLVHQEAIKKIALEINEIHEELDNIRKYIFESKKLFDATNKFMSNSAREIDSIREIDELKLQLENLLKFKNDDIKYLQNFIEFKNEVDSSLNNLRELTNSTKKEQANLLENHLELKYKISDVSIRSDFFEEDIDNLQSEQNNLTESLNVLKESTSSIEAKQSILTDNQVELNNKLDDISYNTGFIKQKVNSLESEQITFSGELIENKMKTSEISTKLSQIKSEHESDLIKLNSELNKNNNLITFHVVELNEKNKDMESEIKEFKLWFKILTSFILAVFVLYIVISLL